MTEHIVAALLVSALVSFAGYRLQALTAGGAMAAMCVGTAIIAGASWIGAFLLGTFFITSSLLSRLSVSQTEAEKDATRDEQQVLANGGAAAMAALSAPWLGDVAVIALIGGALAAATADTWATEVGSRSGHTPRLLLSKRSVPVGVSGGVTLPGTLASMLGALCLGLVAAIGTLLVTSGTLSATIAGTVVTLGGIAGSFVDSVVGETVQQRRYCDACSQESEALVHHCGTATMHSRGWAWVTNDVVNVACTASGLAVAGCGYWLLA